MYNGYIVINQINRDGNITYIVNYGNDTAPLIESFTCDKVIDCFKRIKEYHLMPKRLGVEKIEIDYCNLDNVTDELYVAFKYFENK